MDRPDDYDIYLNEAMQEQEGQVQVDQAFDLEIVGLEILKERIGEALKHFEDDNKIQWTQMPMERPLWEKLDKYVDKQIPKKPIIHSPGTCQYCKKCGEFVSKRDNYCRICGQKLGWE